MESREVLEINLKRRWKEYKMFLLLIAFLEILMMIYGILHFDFHEARRIYYFSAYVILFCFTAVTFFLDSFCMKDEKNIKLVVLSTYIYNVTLIFWSAVISALDIRGGGYPVTYMTILAAIGGVVALKPIYYELAAVVSFVCMIGLAKDVVEKPWFFSFLLNLIFFLVVMILVQYRNYISLQKQFILNRKLEEWAGIDGLTGIANRRSMNEYFEELTREERAYTVALLDADDFKRINDGYGHKEGDRCLIEMSRILSEIFGENVFRYGGDEFVVLSFENEKIVKEKMEAVNLRLEKWEAKYSLQISAGICRNEDKLPEQKLLEYADEALYEAKQRGKARIMIYEK